MDDKTQQRIRDIDNQIKSLRKRKQKRFSFAQLEEQTTRGYGLAVEFFLTLGVSFGLGFFLDKFFHTLPWITIVMSALGLLSGVYRLYTKTSKNNG